MQVREVGEVFAQRQWYPFMLLDLIRARLQGLRGQGVLRNQSVATNKEVITFTDWRNRERKINVQREIH